MRLPRPLPAALLAASALLATAGTTAVTSALTAAPAGAARLPACPLSALAKAKGTVHIALWESMTRANGQTLATITNRFNASQHKIQVTLVPQASYDDTWDKYAAGLSNGQLPALAQLEDQRTQEAIDTRSILPVQSCIDATHYSTADYLPRPLAYWRVNGVQVAMPFAVSNPILYYNKKAFAKAGLNPNDPPTTLPAMLADAKKLKAAGYLVGLKLDPWHLETWLATANRFFVNHDNGRSGRATKAAFDTAIGRQIFADLDALVKGGYAVTNPDNGPDDYDNLLGIGSGKYAMSIDTSAALGTISQVLNSGQYPNVTLGVGPFPVFSARIKGGIEPGGSGLYISNRVPPAQQAAAWKYLTFLDSSASQATWGAGTGYIPVRKSSLRSPTMLRLYAANPGYKVAANQLLHGVTSAATAGSVIGSYADVRQDVLNAEEDMLGGSLTPAQAISQAQSSVNSTLAAYNERLGGS